MTTLMIPDRTTVPAVPHEIDVLDAWLAGRTPHTLRAYRKDLEHFALFLEASGPSQAVSALLNLDAGRAHATALYYRADLVNKGLAPATIARRLAALRSVVKCARMLGRVVWDLEIEAPKAQAYRDTRGPGKDGWDAMLLEVKTKAHAGHVQSIRDLAIVRLLHDLGLRRGELCALDSDDVDRERWTLSVVGKGRSQATRLTLPDPTILALASWLAARGDAPGPLFHRLDATGLRSGRLTGESVRLLVKRLGADVGIGAPVRPHGLRHQAITSALESGVKLQEAMKFARHSNPNTTMIYDDNRLDVAGKVARLIAGE